MLSFAAVSWRDCGGGCRGEEFILVAVTTGSFFTITATCQRLLLQHNQHIHYVYMTFLMVLRKETQKKYFKKSLKKSPNVLAKFGVEIVPVALCGYVKFQIVLGIWIALAKLNVHNTEINKLFSKTCHTTRWCGWRNRIWTYRYLSIERWLGPRFIVSCTLGTSCEDGWSSNEVQITVLEGAGLAQVGIGASQ